MLRCEGVRPRKVTETTSLGYGLRRWVVNVLTVFAFFVAGPAWAQDAQDAKPVTILVLGDSLTAGYGLEHRDGFTAQLQRALDAAGENAEIINAGVSGDTTAGGRSRLLWLINGDIDAVIVELGANDGLRGVDPAQTRLNLDWMLRELAKKQLPTLLSGMMAPPNLGQDYGREFNAIYPELAEKYDVVFDPFFLEGVAADPSLNQRDGKHPTPAGVAVIVERMLPRVRELIARARGATNS